MLCIHVLQIQETSAPDPYMTQEPHGHMCSVLNMSSVLLENHAMQQRNL